MKSTNMQIRTEQGNVHIIGFLSALCQVSVVKQKVLNLYATCSGGETAHLNKFIKISLCQKSISDICRQIRILHNRCTRLSMTLCCI